VRSGSSKPGLVGMAAFSEDCGRGDVWLSQVRVSVCACVRARVSQWCTHEAVSHPRETQHPRPPGGEATMPVSSVVSQSKQQHTAHWRGEVVVGWAARRVRGGADARGVGGHDGDGGGDRHPAARAGAAARAHAAQLHHALPLRGRHVHPPAGSSLDPPIMMYFLPTLGWREWRPADGRWAGLAGHTRVSQWACKFESCRGT
jgi:hypothetical protein